MKANWLFILILIILNSCGNGVKKVYYDTGELFYEKQSLPDNNDSIFYLKEYYKNGHLKHEGLLRDDSIMEGHWKLYYADGILRWEGEYKNSVIQHDAYSQDWTWPNMERYFKGIEVEGHPKNLVVGKTYNFRVEMPEIHPKFRLVVDDEFKDLKNPDNSDLYPYRMTPVKSGKYFINIVFMNKDGYFIVGNPMLHIGFDVVAN